jgi:hypothetical protein
MTTESVVPEVLHPWAIYLRASEEARRRGDRRTGTDHLLLALLEDPSIDVVLGVRDVATKDRLRMTPAAKKVLEEAVRPNRRKLQVTAPQVLAQILALQPPDPAAALLGALGVNTSQVRRRLDAVTPDS